MDAVVMLLFIGVCICGLGGQFWFLREAFLQSRKWGWCCVLVPFASLVFLVVHWKVAKKPFGLYMLGVLFLLLLAWIEQDQ